jgi:hypothetical protein
MRGVKIAVTTGLALVVLAATAGLCGPVKGKVELPAAVAEAVRKNFPDAEIEKVETAKEEGFLSYDIEFARNRGEIEVLEDGTVLDVVVVVSMKDLPTAAASAIQKWAGSAKIERLEKSEIRAEIQKHDATAKIVKLERPKFVYEAELSRGGDTGEIEVAADGSIVEALKWDKKTEGRTEQKERE